MVVARCLARCLILGAFALGMSVARAEPLLLHLELSDNSAPYQQFVGALSKKITSSKLDIQFANADKYDVLLTVGMKATEQGLKENDAALLATMVPKAGFDMLLKKWQSIPHKSLSVIYLDQPWERQIDFVRAVLPNVQRIALLYSIDNQSAYGALKSTAEQHGIQLNAQMVQSSATLFANLEAVLPDSDALLVLPDNVVYNNSNVRNILLTSYRHKVPLIGISQAYVTAGGLAAIFTSPEQLAEDVAAQLISYLKTRKLGKPQYPSGFSVAVNQQVANSLSISIQSAEVVRERVEKLQEGRK